MGARQILCLLGLGLLVISLGCVSSPPRAGVVTDAASDPTGRPGSFAPPVPILTPSGEHHELSNLYGLATVLVFSEEEGEDRSVLTTSVAREAEQSQPLDVVYIEFACPREGCQHGPDEVCARTPRSRNVASMCDGKGRARERFHVTEGNAVFLLDRFGRILDMGRIEDLPRLSRKARDLALAVRVERDVNYD